MQRTIDYGEQSTTGTSIARHLYLRLSEKEDWLLRAGPEVGVGGEGGIL